MRAKLDEDIVWKSNDVELLGVAVDNLRFDKHISNISLQANRKLKALARVDNFVPFKKRRIFFKPFVESQFKHCPLAWCFTEYKSMIR